MLPKNSRWLPFDSCETQIKPLSYWLILSCLDFSMARTKVMPKKGEKGRMKILQMRAVVHAEKWEGPSSPVHPPSPAPQTSPREEEIMRWIAEVEWPEGVGRLPQLLLTQQLVQMAVEARPSTLGGEELARKKLQPTMGGKAPWKEFLKASKVKKTRKYQSGTVALCEICQFQKSTELLIWKLPFLQLVCKMVLEVGKYDLHFQGHTIICL